MEREGESRGTQKCKTYHDERISTLQAGRASGPHRHDDLLADIHDVELGGLEHAQGGLGLPTDDNAVLGHERQHLFGIMLPSLFRG